MLGYEGFRILDVAVVSLSLSLCVGLQRRGICFSYTRKWERGWEERENEEREVLIKKGKGDREKESKETLIDLICKGNLSCLTVSNFSVFYFSPPSPLLSHSESPGEYRRVESFESIFNGMREEQILKGKVPKKGPEQFFLFIYLFAFFQQATMSLFNIKS